VVMRRRMRKITSIRVKVSHIGLSVAGGGMVYQYQDGFRQGEINRV
jgi:hypothetical protein